MKLSIIIPCYNEEEVLHETTKRMKEKMKGLIKSKKISDKSRVMYVNDGSKDKTLSILRDFAKKDKRVRYISFSRNFGKEAGMYAGLSNALGDYVAIMDADIVISMNHFKGHEEAGFGGALKNLGMGSGSGMIYGTTGGVAEAVARHGLPDKSKNTLRELEFSPLRGDESIREATLQVGDIEVRIAVVHGLINAQKLLKDRTLLVLSFRILYIIHFGRSGSQP